MQIVKKELSRIHPQLLQIARNTPTISYSKKNLWLFNGLMHLSPAARIPEGIVVENVHIPGQDTWTKIRMRVYKPKYNTAPVPVLIWLHGGGYVLGTPEMDDRRCIEYVRELGIAVVSVDYRLAPKHPFPAGLEDCYATLEWLISRPPQLLVDEKRIAIGGASAGGGLAAALVQLTHDRQQITPVFQFLVYPMLDDRTVLRSDIDDRNNITWTQKSNRFGWESYLQNEFGAETVPDYSVPARREDLSGMPPAWIGVGSLDLFHDEDMAYAKRLQECGVQCQLDIIPGAFHGFDIIDHQLPVVQDFRKSQIAVLRKHLFQ